MKSHTQRCIRRNSQEAAASEHYGLVSSEPKDSSSFSFVIIFDKVCPYWMWGHLSKPDKVVLVTNTGTMWQLATGSSKNKHTSLGNHTGGTQMLLGITLVYKMPGPLVLISHNLKPLALTWNLTLEIYYLQQTDLNALMQNYEGLRYQNSSRYVLQV